MGNVEKARAWVNKLKLLGIEASIVTYRPEDKAYLTKYHANGNKHTIVIPEYIEIDTARFLLNLDITGEADIIIQGLKVNIGWLFGNNYKLRSVKLKLECDKPISLWEEFISSSLEQIVVEGKVSSLKETFRHCSSLKELDLSKMELVECEDMGWAFHNCRSLTRIDLSNLDMSNVRSMSSIFETCVNLKDLKLGKDLGNVINMDYAFSMCSSLEEIDLECLGSRRNSKEGIKAKSYVDLCRELKRIIFPLLDSSIMRSIEKDMFKYELVRKESNRLIYSNKNRY